MFLIVPRRCLRVGDGAQRRGWSAVKMLRKAGMFQKADERILGDGDFVQNVLSQANEQYERSLRLKSREYDFAKFVEGVHDLYYY